MRKYKFLITILAVMLLCGCNKNAGTPEKTVIAASSEIQTQAETESLTAVEREFERAKTNNRFPAFDMSCEINENGENIYRFYNEEYNLEIFTDNYNYVKINCNDKTLTIDGSFAFFSGTGDYTGMGLADYTGDGKDELVICTVYGGTNNEPAKYIVIELEAMAVYRLIDDIRESRLWMEIDNGIIYEPVSLIELEGVQYIVGKYTESNGNVHYSRDNKKSCGISDDLDEVHIVYDNIVRPTTYNGKLAGKITAYLTGKNQEVSVMNFGSADIWVEITYNSEQNCFEYGHIIGVKYRTEISPDNWYVDGKWQQEYDIAVIADNRTVEYLDYKDDWCIHVVDNNSGVEMYKFLNSENRYEFVYDGKTVETVKDFGYCGWTFADLTGDGVPELIYNDGLYEAKCEVWDLFKTDKTYELNNLRQEYSKNLRIQNAVLNEEILTYEIVFPDGTINTMTAHINDINTTDTADYIIREDDVVSGFKIFYDADNEKVAVKFDIDITNAVSSGNVAACMIFLDYDAENDMVVTQNQPVYSIEPAGWSRL